MLMAFFVFATVASMFLAGKMASSRHRSAKAWVWIAFFFGPIAPLMLCVLGSRASRTAHA